MTTIYSIFSVDLTQDVMVKRIERVSGVVAPREEVKGKGVLADLRKKFRGKLGSVFAAMAIFAVSNEAEAETGNTDNIQYVGDINNPNENGFVYANFSNKTNPRMEEESHFANGTTKIEVDSQHSLIVKAGSNNKILDVLDNATGAVVESITFTGNIRYAVPLGNGYIAVNADNSVNDLYVFNTSEIGSAQGVNPMESSQPSLIGSLVPLYIIENQQGDPVGVGLLGGKAFLYGLGDVVDNPDPNWQMKEAKAVQAIDAGGSVSGNTTVLSSGAVDSDLGVHMAISYDDGRVEYYINPASGVEAPVELPEIQAPASLELNLGNIGSELLEVEVSNVPENGKVVMNIGGIQFELLSLGNEKYEKRFDLNELIGIEKGEFDMTGVVKVLDESGDVVKDENDVEINAEVVMSVDLVAPAKVDFEIEGAVDGVLEVEEVPATAVVKLSQMPDADATTTLSVVSIPMGPGMTMVEFGNMSEEDQVQYVLSFLELQEGSNGQMEVKMGALGSVTSVDANSDTVEVELAEGGVVMSLVSVDEAGNITITVNGYTVVVKQVEEPGDMGGDMGPDMTVEQDMGGDMEPDMSTEEDMGGKADMATDVKPDPNVQPPTSNPGGGDDPMCASTGIGNGGKAPLTPLGALGITIAGAGLAFGRRKRKDNEKSSKTVNVTMDYNPEDKK
jgi:hypothetical protein